MDNSTIYTSDERKAIKQAIVELEIWKELQNRNGRILDSQFLAHLDRGIEYKLSEWKPDQIQNTYLKDFEVPQIVLFDILTNRFPLLQEAQSVAERAFIGTARGSEEICIIDIGIGRGFQMVRLLNAIEKNLHPKKVTIIGIELIKAALDFTDDQLNNLKSQFSFILDYKLLNINAESLKTELLQDVIPKNYDCLLVNASLTLHHIQERVMRINLFRVVNYFNPDLMILIEPDADTFTDEYGKRLINAANHFSSLYEYVNTLSFSPEEDRSIKSFFSNDFMDPIAFPDAYRFERLQTSEGWINIAQEAGFKKTNIHSYGKDSEMQEIQIILDGGGYINYVFREIPLLSIIGLI